MSGKGRPRSRGPARNSDYKIKGEHLFQVGKVVNLGPEHGEDGEGGEDERGEDDQDQVVGRTPLDGPMEDHLEEHS